MIKTTLVCEACNKNIAIGVCCVPGVPISCAYCTECIKVNSHPMWALIANTVCCGSLDTCADWWKEMVYASLKHQNKTLEWFNQAVITREQEMNSMLDEDNNEHISRIMVR